jgi:large subunit ribosomal protein L35
MPKMKTKRGAAKRFKFTASGKIRRSRAFLRHILAHKSRKQKRRLGSPALVSAADEHNVRRMLPYD